MKIRSTGLGKQLLTAQIGTIELTKTSPATLEPGGVEEPTRLLMTMEVVQPIHWTVRAFMQPGDLRRLIKLIVTRPNILFGTIRFLLSPNFEYKEFQPAKTGSREVSEPVKES